LRRVWIVRTVLNVAQVIVLWTRPLVSLAKTIARRTGYLAQTNRSVAEGIVLY